MKVRTQRWCVAYRVTDRRLQTADVVDASDVRVIILHFHVFDLFRNGGRLGQQAKWVGGSGREYACVYACVRGTMFGFAWFS